MTCTIELNISIVQKYRVHGVSACFLEERGSKWKKSLIVSYKIKQQLSAMIIRWTKPIWENLKPKDQDVRKFYYHTP
jgi:hypothetical protein